MAANCSSSSKLRQQQHTATAAANCSNGSKLQQQQQRIAAAIATAVADWSGTSIHNNSSSRLQQTWKIKAALFSGKPRDESKRGTDYPLAISSSTSNSSSSNSNSSSSSSSSSSSRSSSRRIGSGHGGSPRSSSSSNNNNNNNSSIKGRSCSGKTSCEAANARPALRREGVVATTHRQIKNQQHTTAKQPAAATATAAPATTAAAAAAAATGGYHVDLVAPILGAEDGCHQRRAAVAVAAAAAAAVAVAAVAAAAVAAAVAVAAVAAACNGLYARAVEERSPDKLLEEATKIDAANLGRQQKAAGHADSCSNRSSSSSSSSSSSRRRRQ
ncbi:hypothetical protein ACSSS7_008140 [Eimeria intestinalis]